MSKYSELCEVDSDINEHLVTLRDLAKECDHVTEMGVRYIVSSWAFVEGLEKGKTLISIDITHPSVFGGDLDAIKRACSEKGINFEFRLGDTRLIDIEETDLLFIDTLHRYGQLKIELERHANKARKYLVFHDTSSFEFEGENGIDKGLWPAIEEFLAEHKEWKIKKRYTNNNGLLICERVC